MGSVTHKEYSAFIYKSFFCGVLCDLVFDPMLYRRENFNALMDIGIFEDSCVV